MCFETCEERVEQVRGAGFERQFTGKNMSKICLREFESPKTLITE